MVDRITVRFLPGWSSLLSLLLALTLMACSKELVSVGTTGGSTTPVSVVNPSVTFDETTQKLLIQGPFTNGAHTTTGTAKVYEKDGKRTLVFTDFKTDAGPDLYIYVAEDKALTNFISVSKLTTTGNFFVELPSDYAPAKHRSVIIWCKAFTVTFGSATLK